MPITLNLHEIFAMYNSLVPVARELGWDVKPWVSLPSDRDHGMKRLNWIRNKCGLPAIETPETIRTDLGAAMPLAYLQREWNRLVPTAQAQGIRVRPWTRVPSTARHGLRRLSELRDKLNSLPAHVAEIDGRMVVVSDISVFTGMTFGVEIECYMPIGMTSSELSAKVRAAGVECYPEAYNHSVRRFWKIVTDGSLHDMVRGVELVSPVLTGEAGFSDIAKVCKVLTSIGCKVSQKAGLHVHVGCRNENPTTLRRIACNYSYYQNVIDGFLAPSRRDANYAKRLRTDATVERATSVNEVILSVGQNPHTPRAISRQAVVNFQSLNSYGTVEFRQHQGSVEAEKVLNWVKFCGRMVIASRTENAALNERECSLAGLMAMLEMPAKGREYFEARTARFNGPTLPYRRSDNSVGNIPLR